MTSTPLGGTLDDPDYKAAQEKKIERALEEADQLKQGNTPYHYDPATYNVDEEEREKEINEPDPIPGTVLPENQQQQQVENSVIPEDAEYADDPNIEYINGKPFYTKEAQKAAAKAEVGRSIQQTSIGIGYLGSAPVLGMLDFGMDAIGNIPGGASIDNWYDEKTKFDSNPNLQKVREAMSVIVPTAVATMTLGPAAGQTAARVSGGSAIAKGLATLGVTVASDVAVTANSDLAGRDDNLMRGLGDFLDDMGNPLGMSIPNAIKTMDGDSPAVRRFKNTVEAGGLSIIGDALGYVLKGAMRPPMQWFEPKNEVAARYKNDQIKINMEPDTAAEVSRLDSITENIDIDIKLTGPAVRRLQQAGALTNADLSTVRNQMLRFSQSKKAFQEREINLINEYIETGKSSVTKDPLESYVKQSQVSREWQIDDSAASKIHNDVDNSNFDADVMSEIFPESATARQSIPQGNIARNKADITAIETGTSIGTPTPIISEPMMRKGFTEDTREVIADLNASDKMAGKYNAVIDSVKYESRQMDEASMNLYRKIVNSTDPEEINELLLTKLDIEELATMTVGKRQAARAIEEDTQTRAMAFALRELTEKYLSQDVNLQSARVIKTLSSEVSDIARSTEIYAGSANEERVSNLVLDKIQFLMEEYGISKYIWGWSGNNKKWWKQLEVAPPEKRLELVQNMNSQMEAGIQERKKRAQNYRSMFETLKQKGDHNTAMAIVKAYDWSNGDIDTIAGLNAWINKEMSPLGMLYSRDKDLNMFADGAKSVIYNHILSGRASLNALKGNLGATIVQPINGMIGAGWEAIEKKSTEPIRRGLYAYQAMWRSQQKAWANALDVFLQASDDPTKYMDRLRTDYRFGNPDKWDIMDTASRQFAKDGEMGKVAMYSFMKAQQHWSLHALPRWGMNAMLAVDKATEITQATLESRFRAWSEVFEKAGKVDQETLELAENKHYAKVFNSEGIVKDDFVDYRTREIALNLDNDVASVLTAVTNKVPALTPFMMFPKTGINAIRTALSYTPLTKAGFGRYGRVITAKTDEEINAALLENGITSFTEDPAMGRMMHQNLKNEYHGRVAMGSFLALGMANYAMQGNIRGHGPYNPSEMRKIRMNFPGWKPKQIKVLGQWVSYEGLPVLDPILALVGDFAYNARDVSSSLTEDLLRKVGFSFVEALGDKAGLGGLEPIIAIAKGDETALNRFFAQETRKAIPMSGAIGVLARLDDSHKDIYQDYRGYIMNTIPGLKNQLPNHIDPWTGDPINDVDNPILRAFNAFSPIQVTDGNEDWREWLFNSGWQGMSMLRKDATGIIDYEPSEREQILKLMGKDKLWVHIKGGELPDGTKISTKSALMYNEHYNDEINELRTFRQQGMKWEKLELKMNQMDVYKHLNAIIKDSQKRAQQTFIDNNPGLAARINAQKMVDEKLKNGGVSAAVRVGNTKEKELQQLLQYK